MNDQEQKQVVEDVKFTKNMVAFTLGMMLGSAIISRRQNKALGILVQNSRAAITNQQVIFNEVARVAKESATVKDVVKLAAAGQN